MNTTAFSTQRNRWLAAGAVVLIALALISTNDCSASGTTCFNLVQLTLNGLLVGGVYSLVALGIVVVNKASGVFNFAHGFMMLLGAMIFWQVFTTPPSAGFAGLLAFFAGATAFGVLSFYVDESQGQEVHNQTRLQRWTQQLSSPIFIRSLGMAIVAAILYYLLLRNLEHAILRGALGAIVGSAAMGLIIERITIRPLLGQPVLTAIMMTLGISLLLQGFTSLFWGTQPHPLPVFVEPQKEEVTKYPIGVDQETGEPIYQEIVNVLPAKALPNYRVNTEGLLGGNLSFQRNLVWGFAIALLSFTGFVLFFQFTGVGLAMRAVAENQVLAESVGLRVRSILAIVWGIAAAMAMIAGVIQGTGPGVGVSILVIPALAFRAFPAVLLGGLDSITGALVGGLMIGVIEVLTVGLVDSAAGQEFAPFFALLVVLMIRPEGLFGQHRIDRV